MYMYCSMRPTGLLGYTEFSVNHYCNCRESIQPSHRMETDTSVTSYLQETVTTIWQQICRDMSIQLSSHMTHQRQSTLVQRCETLFQSPSAEFSRYLHGILRERWVDVRATYKYKWRVIPVNKNCSPSTQHITLCHRDIHKILSVQQ